MIVLFFWQLFQIYLTMSMISNLLMLGVRPMPTIRTTTQKNHAVVGVQQQMSR